MKEWNHKYTHTHTAYTHKCTEWEGKRRSGRENGYWDEEEDTERERERTLKSLEIFQRAKIHVVWSESSDSINNNTLQYCIPACHQNAPHQFQNDYTREKHNTI